MTITTPASRNPLKHLRGSDIRGIVQLATQATAGVTHIVEGVHQSVLNTISGAVGPALQPTRGITGLVYRSIHLGTRLVGKSVDTLLARLQMLFESADDSDAETPQREAILAALNGVMGDRLAASNNPFSIPMALRYKGAALNWQSMPPMPGATGKVLLLIHGLCMNDRQWHTQRLGQVASHGDALHSTLGYSPVYLRYNSGLHTAQNGRELSAQLEQLVTHWPTQIEELTVVAHSMGGLLARSAFHYAKQEGLCWPNRLKNIVFLGTPHHGAPLERVGNWLEALLGSMPYTAPFARLGQMRSAGITDLRYGHVLDEDWHGQHRFHRKADNRQVVSLPAGVSCYTVAATTAATRSLLAERLIGDGLVPLHSALGKHDDAERSLAFSRASQWIAYRMNHMQLLTDPEVTRQMLRWLTPGQG